MMRKKGPAGRILLAAIGIAAWVAQPAAAQQSGSAASGGSRRPERPSPARRSPVQQVIASPSPEPAASPSPSPSPEPSGTPAGSYSFTYGLSANDKPRDGGSQAGRAGFAFSVYVTRRLFLEIDNDNLLTQRVPAEPWVTGLGDTTGYLGVDALLEGTRRPAASLLYALKLPTASESKGLGSGEVDHMLLGVLAKTFGRTTVELDAGDYIAGRTGESGFDHFPFAAFVVTQEVSKSGNLHLELGGDFKTSKSDAKLYAFNYYEHKLPRGIRLRAGFRVGITSNSPRFGLYLALKRAGQLGKAKS
jgi:hypothetical protein